MHSISLKVLPSHNSSNISNNLESDKALVSKIKLVQDKKPTNQTLSLKILSSNKPSDKSSNKSSENSETESESLLNDKISVKLNINDGPNTSPSKSVQVGADNYSRYQTQREHIYNVSDTYVSSDEQLPRTERILDLDTGLFKEANITLPEAVERIFIEIASNAGDNVARSFREGVDPGEVLIKMNKHTISVRNGGIPIPVVMKQEWGCWVPEGIFGILMTSSNYNKSKIRTECGRNGFGAKCISSDTLVPLWNGNIKRAKELEIGDQLIGDDGKIRNIKNIIAGSGKMHQITQANGETYKVNDQHILTLHMPDHKVIFWNTQKNGWSVLWWDRNTKNISSKTFVLAPNRIICPQCGVELSGNLKRHYTRKHPEIPTPKNARKSPTKIPPDTEEIRNLRREIENFCKTIPDDNTIDITINDYISLNKTTQLRLAGIRNEMVQWSKKDVKLDPYILGLWLGDGVSTGYVYVCDGEKDTQIIDYLNEWCKDNDANIRKSGKYTYTITSKSNYGKKNCAPLVQKLKIYNLIYNKHIPLDYIVNDRETRLKVLAGLIDTDGTVQREGTRVTICQGLKHKNLVNDIVLLARSLGFYCSLTMKNTTWTHKAVLKKGLCYNINISGNIGDIPTRLPRKKCANIKTHSYKSTGYITVKDIGMGEYIGISIDENERFVINDFTVTHNCTNIFSKKFNITVADPHNEKIYKQSWSENMTQRTEPDIQHYDKSKPAFVEVVYNMDFPRFKYLEYPDETFSLFARHAADMSFTLKIPVVFEAHLDQNKVYKKNFNINTAKEYAKLYIGKEKIKNFLLYIDWPEGTEIITKGGVNFSKNKGVLPSVEICAVDTPDEAIKVAFVNGMWTRNGGVHYESAFKAISSGIIKNINENKKNTNEKTPKITPSDVKKHISIFVNCWLGNPKFDSQSKNELKSPTPKIVISDDILKCIGKWEVVSRLYAELDAKLFRTIIKTDGKKKRFLSGMDKLDEANKAATNESHNCTLYITEGDSAKTFANKLCSYVPGGKGRDYIGVYALRGKPLNVMNAPYMTVAENKEINELKKILGLREGVDYTIDENYKTLRYGHLMILTDADIDGKHILGLILNLFYCKFPTLLMRGYIKYMRTKILEVQKGKNRYKFYTQHDYDEWKKNTPDWNSWTTKYFKGLGTSTDMDIQEESLQPRFVSTYFDDSAPRFIRLAFDQSLSNNRKMWITQWVPDYRVETLNVQPISDFINHEFIQFSIADICRSVPRFLDGLKTSQRKIIWGAMLYWGLKQKKEEVKVAQLAAYISQKLNYHYGEKSLENAIVGLAQNFPGSNNLPYLQREGQFGSRSLLGKDAAHSRYIKTKLENYIPYIFRKEDIPILDIIEEEGKKIEPVTLLPIIPMHLVNGVLGIGTGWSSNIVSHDPLDLVYWLQCKILGKPLINIKPWYRDFSGEISLKYKQNAESEEDHENDTLEFDNNTDDITSEKDTDEVCIDKNTKISMISKGVFNEIGKNKIVVTEIPIGRSINKYKLFLDILREKKIIKKYQNYSTPDKPNFQISGMQSPSLRTLKLIKSYGMSNMVLLSNDNKPIKYDTVNDILESFYTLRLAYYVKRKTYIINDIDIQLSLISNKINFVLAVIKGYDLLQTDKSLTIQEANSQGAILVIKKNKKEVEEQMQILNFDTNLLKKISLHNLTLEEVQALQKEMTDLQIEKEIKTNTRPEDLWLSDLSDFVKVYCKHYAYEYIAP